MALEPLGIQAIAAGVPNFVRDLGHMDKAIAGVGRSGDNLGRQFTALGGSVIRMGALFSTALVGAASVAGAALVGLGAIGLREAINAEEVNAQLEAVLAATAGTAGITADRARELALRYRDLARGSDEAVLAGEAVLLRFKNIRGEAFEPALQTALDLAAVLKTDVATAASQLGRALELPGEGLRALRAAGIVLTDEQQKLIDNLVETGRIAEAQTFLMDALASSIGGTAARAANTFSGRLAVLRGHIREQVESIGFVLLPAIDRLVHGLTPLVEQVLPLLVELFRSRIGPAVDEAVGFILNLVDTLIDAGPVSLEFRDALLALLPTDLQDRITTFTDQVAGAFEKVKTFITDNKDAIVGAIEGIGAALAAAAVVATIAKIASIIGALTSPIGILLTLIGLLKAAWDTNFLGIRDTLTQFWETTGRPIFDRLVAFLQTSIPKAITFLSNLFRGTLGPALGEAGGKFQPLIEAVGKLVQAFVEDFPAMAAQGQEIITFLTTTLGPTFDRILGSVVNVIGRFTEAWERSGDDVIQVVGTLVKIVLATLENFILVITGLADIWTAIWTGDFAGAIDAARVLIETFLGNALASVNTTIEDILGVFEGIGNNLGTILRVGLGWVIDNVIAPWGRQLLDAVTGIATGLVSAVAGALGIGSPSKVMMAIGEDMMKGLAAGIQAASPMPAVAMHAAAAQSVAGGSSSETNLNLHINTAARAEPIAADFRMMQALAERV